MYAAIGYGGLQLARILPKLKEEYTRLKATEPAAAHGDGQACSFF